MATQPQTIYAVADSPVGLATWMFNHDAASYQDVADAFAGHPVGNLTRDQVLDDVTFYWLTNTAVSSARLYWENTVGFFNVKNVSIPAAITVFPHEIYQAPRSWAEKAYPSSCTSTRSTEAVTSLPGRSRPCSPPSSAPPSGRCASERPAGPVRLRHV
jgi:hypothetical protein